MDKDALLQEQLEYLQIHKEEIFREFVDFKVGMSLNLPYYFGAILYYTLKKKYTYVHGNILTERFLSDHFADVMDRSWTCGDEEFSVKESLKMEAKLKVITDYVKEIAHKEKVYPSQVKRKEKALMAKVERAHKIIDAYFKERDIQFQEISSYIDMFEVVILNDGNQVDLHIGYTGFSLSEKHSSKDILSYVESAKMEHKEKIELVETEYNYMAYLIEKIEELIPNNEAIIQKMYEYEIPHYTIKKLSVEKLKEAISKYTKNLEEFLSFLERMKYFKLSIPEEARINSSFQALRIDDFMFDFSIRNVRLFQKQLNNYEKVRPLLKNLKEKIKKEQLSPDITVKDDRLIIKANFSFSIQHFRNVKNRQAASLHFQLKDGKIYRLSGEKVLTSEVILFELMELSRNSEERYFLSVEKAKEMFIATLSETEEKVLLEENMTIIEGEKNFYALIASESYNNVVKIPKELKSKEEIKALCIHPEDSNVPKFDGFAAIALSVKSGDEDYVLQNSNEFSLSKIMKEKLQKVFSHFDSLRHVQLT